MLCKLGGAVLSCVVLLSSHIGKLSRVSLASACCTVLKGLLWIGKRCCSWLHKSTELYWFPSRKINLHLARYAE